MSPSGSGPDPPQLVRVFWRGTLFIALASFFTVSVMILRGLIGGFGWEPWSLSSALGTTLLSGALVLPLAAIVDVPDAIFRHWIPERRFARGRCPACGYSTAHVPEGECPECGAARRQPAPYTVTWRTLQRSLALAIPAWMLGCAIGLTLVFRDEQAFVVETRARCARDASLTFHTRPRAGVGGFGELWWSIDRGFEAGPPFPQPKERLYAPKR